MCLKSILALITLSAAVSSVMGIAIEKRSPNEDVDDESGDHLHNNAELHHDHGYSFHKFSGPVSGEIKQIYVPDGAEGKKLDFYATPDYTYSYGVTDPKTGNKQQHQESRQGDVVHGQYSVQQADGTTRVVKYTADPTNGFQATVEYHR